MAHLGDSHLVDPDVLELHRLVSEIKQHGLHLHRHALPGPRGRQYRWVVVGDVLRRGKDTCDTPACFRLKLKNMEPADDKAG